MEPGAVRKRQRFAEIRLEAADERELLAGHRFLNLLRGRALGFQLLDDRVGRRFEVGERVPGRGVMTMRNSPTSSLDPWPADTLAAACWS